MVLPPARPDGVHFFVNVGAVAQQAQPAHQTHILRTQLADGEHPQPTRSKHRQQGAVLKLAHHPGPQAQVVKPPVQGRAQRRMHGGQQHRQFLERLRKPVTR